MKKLTIALMFLTGCSSASVRPATWNMAPTKNPRVLCLKDNPAIVDRDVRPAIEEAFVRNGINYKVISGGELLDSAQQAEVLLPSRGWPEGCDYVMTYYATTYWDLVTFLNHAEFRIQDVNYQEIGFGEYHMALHGGFDFSKYSSTRTKVAPVLDQLLK